MATLDIFNNDAFSVTSLISTITDIPRVPTQLGDEGLFTESGMTTTTAFIERQGSGLKLVPAAPRGGVADTVGRENRKLIPVAAVHLPQRDTIMADEVQGIRAFGSETDVEAVQALVRRQLAQLKANLDMTLEYHRIGALKGVVLDADGASELYDLYDIFDMTQTTQYWNIATNSTPADPKRSCIELKRLVQSALGGRAFRRVRVKCSEGFFDDLIAHKAMKEAWERWQDGAFARQDQTTGDFEFAGVVFQIYAGGVGGQDFIADGEAYAYPEGVPGMFVTKYAPADYMETVNTMGLPYYAKQERMSFDKGVQLESQSNPVMLNTLPEAAIKLSASAQTT